METVIWMYKLYFCTRSWKKKNNDNS